MFDLENMIFNPSSNEFNDFSFTELDVLCEHCFGNHDEIKNYVC